jgi:SAM-dependent methyltransferase
MSQYKWYEDSKRVQDKYRERFRFSGTGYYLWQKYPELEAIQNKLSVYNPLLHSDPRVLKIMRPEPRCKLLDLGCGRSLSYGHFKLWECEYYGVDICREAFLEESPHSYNRGPVVKGMIQANGLNRPFATASFDLVCCIGVLEYYTPLIASEILKEISRVCCIGGRLYVNIPNIQHPLATQMLLIEEARGCSNYLWSTQEVERII